MDERMKQDLDNYITGHQGEDQFKKPPADWQLGFDLALLKQFAAVFKAAHKPHVYGAFGLVKERDVATAMSERRFVHKKGNGSAAAAIFKTLSSTSTHKTFYGRDVKVQAGDTIVSAFATTSEPLGVSLLMGLREKYGQAGMWVEIFEEDALAKRVVTELGFHWVDTKIMAGSEIKGLYVLGRFVPPLRDPAELATLTLLAEAFLTVEEHKAILGELETYAGEWAQHYSSYNKGSSWTAFALRGYKPNEPEFIIRPDEMSKAWKEENADLLDATCEDTVAAKHFPQTLAAVGRIPGVKDRVRMMRLAAKGGELARHADITLRDAGVGDGKLARLHISLRTNPAVTFKQWDARGAEHVRHFPERSLFYLDQRKPHAVQNPGECERTHLVVDVSSGPELRARLERLGNP